VPSFGHSSYCIGFNIVLKQSTNVYFKVTHSTLIKKENQMCFLMVVLFYTEIN